MVPVGGSRRPIVRGWEPAGGKHLKIQKREVDDGYCEPYWNWFD
jgi:hypothetical protein